MRDRTTLTAEVKQACPATPTVFGKETANCTGPPVYECCTSTAVCTGISSALTSEHMCIESADRGVEMVIDGGVASGYMNLGDIMCSKRGAGKIGIGDSFDTRGTYLGQSVAFSGGTFHFWGEVNVTGDMYVIGSLSVEGPLKVGGDLYVTGDLTTKDDVMISGGLTVRGSVSAHGDDVTISCHSLADVNDMRIFGAAAAEGTFILHGTLEIMKEGKLDIGTYDAFTFARNGDTRSIRLMVDDDAEIDVRGILDAS
ncbi:MAG: hypothetical protein FWD81_05315, partial [Methanomassiliicoccaceae archaeon]|nr:hypothetical protein [Methanomassiliicoccaceae archaeon]